MRAFTIVLMLVWGTIASAQTETVRLQCNKSSSATTDVTAIIEEEFRRHNRKWSYYPISSVQPFLTCDEAFIDGFLEVYSAEISKHLKDKSDIIARDKSKLFTRYLYVAAAMYNLGKHEHFIDLIERLRTWANEGDVKAARALVELGSGRTLFNEFSNAAFYMASENFFDVKYFQERAIYVDAGEANFEIVDANLIEIVARLKMDVEKYLRFGADDPAQIIAKFKAETGFMEACTNTAEVENVFANADDRRAKFQELSDAVDASPHDVYDVAVLALMLFDVASDCEFTFAPQERELLGLMPPDGGYGFDDRQLAFKMLKTYATYWENKNLAYEAYRGREGLAIALMIDETNDDPGSNYAAARFLLHGLATSWGQFGEYYQRFIPRFSKSTISEAQKLMKADGLYTSVIDGIPGRNFRNGVMALECHGGKQTFPSICLYGNKFMGTAKDIHRSEWAEPYLH